MFRRIGIRATLPAALIHESIGFFDPRKFQKNSARRPKGLHPSILTEDASMGKPHRMAGIIFSGVLFKGEKSGK